MQENWEKHPQRIGMVVGFVALPLLWMLQEVVLRLAFGAPMPFASDLLRCFAVSAIPGAILGAGISQAVLARQAGNWRRSKRHLLFHSFVIVAWYAATSSISLWQHWPRLAPGTSLGIVTFGGIQFSWWAFPFFLHLVWANAFKFPLHCALLTLFVGFLMRSRR